MNSGYNSGSMQSSSGGDDEYDSRDELISGFINPSSQKCPISNSQPPFTQHFDPPSVQLAPFKPSPPPPPPKSNSLLLNFDLDSSRGLTSQLNCTASSQSILGARGSNNLAPFQTPSPVWLPSASQNGELASTSQPQAKVVRHSKKRSRASRRAPTTVLITDTTNFRAMVQEFTGIPAPPFSAASSFSRSRFDVFNTASTARSPYPLLRPSAQKIQIPSIQSSWFPSLAMIDSISMTSKASNSLNKSNIDGSFKLQETEGLRIMHGNANANTYNSLALSDKAFPKRNKNTLNSSVGVELNDWVQVPLQSCPENYGKSQMVSNSKMKYAAASSLDFHAERGSENVSSRGEGMVDSWICSSD